VEFKELVRLQQAHIKNMVSGVTKLFRVNVDKEVLYATYLESFPAGKNGLFRAKREYECSSCRSFIKNFGDVVAIKNGQVVTPWGFQTNDPVFQPVMDALDALIKICPITEVFVTKTNVFGQEKSREETANGIITWFHLNAVIPNSFVTNTSDSVESVMGPLRDTRNVFKRSLQEISQNAIDVTLELIAQRTLYRGTEFKGMVDSFNVLKKQYDKLSPEGKDLFCWEKFHTVHQSIAKMRDAVIGTFLVDLSEGTDVEVAIRKYEIKNAPENYKRPKAEYTPKMLEEEKAKLVAEGLMPSLYRKHATIDDITLNNLRFANKDAVRRITGDPFDDMMKDASSKAKSYGKVDEITIEKFFSEVLPTAKNLEILFENHHIPNLVSLVAPKYPDAKSLLKWDNGFSWAYKDNVADSMKERVKSAGGKVDGVLRFSIQWNDDRKNHSDLDAHCEAPGCHIHYSNKVDNTSGGTLDVDIQTPERDVRAPGGIAVENITWPTLSRMREGTYRFYVRNFTTHGLNQSGFSAEIEFDGETYTFEHPAPVRPNSDVHVAEVTFTRKDGFKLKDILSSSSVKKSKNVWGISTNEFHPVTVAMLSPNYWDDNKGVGNKHFMFMLKDCVNESAPNGFFNEFVKDDYITHKRVFEALGSRMAVEVVADQLSGLGFSDTLKKSFICKVEGALTRTLKVSI
jgi:hypothetical protein